MLTHSYPLFFLDYVCFYNLWGFYARNQFYFQIQYADCVLLCDIHVYGCVHKHFILFLILFPSLFASSLFRPIHTQYHCWLLIFITVKYCKWKRKIEISHNVGKKSVGIKGTFVRSHQGCLFDMNDFSFDCVHLQKVAKIAPR